MIRVATTNALRGRNVFLRSALPLAVIVALAGGCGGGSDNNAATSPAATPSATAERGAQAEPKTQLEPVDPPMRPDAAAAVNAVFEGLRNNRPEALWEFLPPRYREDINALVRDFAARIDPAVWDAAVANLRRAVRLLETHRDLILAPAETAGQGGASEASLAELRANRDAAHALLATLVGSELADRERLKSFDGGKFLAESGGRLLAQSNALTPTLGAALEAERRERFAGAVAELVETPDLPPGQAIVLIRGPAGEINEVPFVLVDGRWIPESLRDGWNAQIADLRRTVVEEFPETVTRHRAEILARFDTIGAIIGQLEKARTRADFNAALAAALPQVQSLLREVGALPDPPRLDAPEGDAIVVIVRPAADRELEEELQIRLGALCDDAELGTAIPVRTTEGTRFNVSPVRDPAAFARRINFARVVEHDAAQRRIVLELEAPAANGTAPNE